MYSYPPGNFLFWTTFSYPFPCENIENSFGIFEMNSLFWTSISYLFPCVELFQTVLAYLNAFLRDSFGIFDFCLQKRLNCRQQLKFVTSHIFGSPFPDLFFPPFINIFFKSLHNLFVFKSEVMWSWELNFTGDNTLLMLHGTFYFQFTFFFFFMFFSPHGSGGSASAVQLTCPFFRESSSCIMYI